MMEKELGDSVPGLAVPFEDEREPSALIPVADRCVVPTPLLRNSLSRADMQFESVS